MTGTIPELLIAAIGLVGSHFGISSTALRADLVRRLGERAYLGLYSALALVLIVWLIVAHAEAPYVELWPTPAWLATLTLVVMALAVLLLVGGLTQRNPTIVMQASTQAPERPAPGVLAVTRHPLMWAIGLWALAHLVVNGDLASLIFFGAFAVMALLGTRLIDARKQRSWPAEEWRRFANASSNLPFAALLSGRNELRLAEIGWWRLGLAIVLYVALILLHGLVIGVSATPM